MIDRDYCCSIYENPDDIGPYHRGAIFTAELGSLIENGFNIGLDAYPIFDENYRKQLNDKIIRHYWFREIGFETPGMFKEFLNRKMNEIMPFYNQLYNSTLIQFDPLQNYDMTTTGSSKGESAQVRDYERQETTETNATSDTSNDTESKARTLVSVTPQMQLSGQEDYATNLTDSESNTKSNGKSEQNSNALTNANDTTNVNANSMEDYASRVVGLSGITNSQAILQFRETFLNIDMLIIGELGGLFMGIYTDYWNAL